MRLIQVQGKGRELVPYCRRACFYAFGAVLFFALRATAFFRPSAELTVGARNYLGTTVSADWGGAFHFVPAFSAYRSDDSSGTYRTYSLGIFYDRAGWTWGLTGGFTPEVDKYRNEFLGVETEYSFRPEGTRLMLGAFHVVHSDRHVASSPEGPVFEPDALTDVHQTDFHAGGEVPVGPVRLNAALTESRYGQDLGHLSQAESKKIFPRGDDFVVRGFPRSSYTLGMDLPSTAIGVPYVSFTYTRFELDVPVTKIIEGGLETEIGSIPVDLSLELDAWGGEWSIAPYFSVRFGPHTPSIIDEKGW